MAKQPQSETGKRFKARADEQRRLTDEAQRKMDEATPTPTEEEMQQVMANIADGRGADIELAQSGDPEEPGVNQPIDAVPVAETRVMTASTSSDAAYSTRTADAPTADASAKRGPGRPRKDEGGSA